MMRRPVQAGLTLIEMMIAILISMILSIAVMSVMSSSEGRRRTLGSASDLDQTGSLAMYQMDRWIRSAGTGFVRTSASSYGCRLFASAGGTQLLPLTAALPAPFATFTENTAATTDYRLAPVVIVSGGTTPSISGRPSDVLVMMATGNDGSQVPTPLKAPPQAAALSLKNFTEFSPNDLLLLVDGQPAAGGGPAPCLVSQAASTTGTTGVGTSLSLAGTYYAATVNTRSVTDFTGNASAIDLGGVNSGTGTSLPPNFQVVGVGDNNTLFSYDLLGLATPALQAQAEGVFEIHAVYGIDSTGNSNNQINHWVKADSTSAYSANNLTDGSAGAVQLLKNIRAVRLAIIMRTALPERDASTTSTPDTLTMFSDLESGTIPFSRPMSAAEKLYRYRVIETTIPVRNNQY